MHKVRQRSQESVLPELHKLTKKRDQSVLRKISCQASFVRLHSQLGQAGLSFEAHLEDLRDQQRRREDPNIAEHNSTVREYETVNVSEEQGEEKRQRIY
jgi:hypothetical protein